MAGFDWWLLIVGLVVGGGVTWLVIADARRREDEVDEVELPREALWLAATMTEDGDPIAPETAEQLLRLHRAYLSAPPPDEPEPGERPVDDPAHPTVPPSAADGPDVDGDRAEAQPPIRNVGQTG